MNWYLYKSDSGAGGINLNHVVAFYRLNTAIKVYTPGNPEPIVIETGSVENAIKMESGILNQIQKKQD